MSFFGQLKDGKSSETFFKVFHEKMESAQTELKSSSTVNTGEDFRYSILPAYVIMLFR